MSVPLRLTGVALVLGLSCLAPPAPASALGPPGIDDGALGAAIAVNARGGPPDETEQRSVCAEPMLGGGPPRDAPLPQRILDLPAAWEFSRGGGQKVAVIDTGVNRHPRLPALQPGGDFVSNSDGTSDCDGHGTLVAGLIAARPSPDDAFSGVAPDAEILAIRQLSLAYEPKDRARSEVPGKIASAGYGNVLTLAAAVVRAVDMGAGVINISEVACTPLGGDPADGALGAAVKYAYDRNVVVVAAAGNIQQGGACDGQNEGTGWGAVRTAVSPAWFAPYVLSVASVEADGTPSPFSIHGPWVGVAAPGRNIVSLDSKPGATGLVDSVQTAEGVGTIDGTSFSSAYVSGLAALVRARFPQLSAQQVIDRITRTAQQPGSGRDDRIGHGLVDPLAALTAQLPERPVNAGADVARPIPPPPPPPHVDPMPRRVATIGAIVLLALLGIGFALSVPFRRGRGVVDPAETGEGL
ncbi:type VII secretion-associated serine protease mycosin [Nocardia sp. NBC_00508]|uniref:type VII secretion-associated serine protease mycosin n=1 Tax=Nocardia sp. NBC_00508 TaxID=2975992 RepID=UPI002E80FA39|nr:type VII secretion-associated serine protease mycosin [Nocardia sp. NBC_00508]WUD68637.1 type VII secretion-associated serine protease mycosin [Nocardia sp. NBC_00508]